MKGILMFDSLNDLIFFNVDDELKQHLKNLASKDGLLEDMSFRKPSNKDTVDRDVVMQLFSPLIASYKVMQAQFGNKYKYLETEIGVVLVFDEILNHVVIGISSVEETVEEVQHEVSVFLVLLKMLYGPALNMMKYDISTCCGPLTRHELLSEILERWRLLKMEQQMFLVEAVERLLVNQDITAMCVNLLQEVLEKIRSVHKIGAYCHSFALVDTKLLALYSSRNTGQLPKETLLLLILTIQVLRGSVVSLEHIDEIEHQMAEEQFFIPVPNSSKANPNSSKKKSKQDKKLNDQDFNQLQLGAQTLMVYLKSRVGILVPHLVYLIKVTQRISLVLICEMTAQGIAASTIFSVVELLHNLQHHPAAKLKLCSFESLDRAIKTIIDSIWKMKIEPDKTKCLKKLILKWEQVKNNDIEIFFHEPRRKSIDACLDSAISSLCECLKLVFEEIIATPNLEFEAKSWRSDHQEVLKNIQKLSAKRLKDIADYLEVKALQNITMTSYLTEYPGLIHFIYIDRSTDCVIAPSVILRKGHLNGATSLKKKIWKMVSFGRRYIDGSNNFCCLWKDEGLHYFYTVWFEDSTGKFVKPTAFPSIKKYSMKGILCENFYRNLVKQCFPAAAYEHILCYELFCIHLESTTAEQIVAHSKRLCSQLWSFTGAYRTSLDLL